MTSSTEIIASIKARNLIPSSQQTFSDNDILRFANEEISSEIVPLLIRYNEEYLIREVMLPLEEGKIRYRIPPRAMGGRLRDVYWLDQNGNPVSIPKVERGQVPSYGVTGSRPTGYYLEGNDIRLLPFRMERPEGRLVVVIAVKPNQLVQTNRCRKIIQVTASSITVPSVPPHFQPGERLDVLSQWPGAELRDMDLLITGIQGNIIHLSGGALDLAEPGDWVALAGESPVEQFPSDLHTYLLELISMRLLQAQGNVQGQQIKAQAIQRLQQTIPALIDNRVVGGSHKIINRNSLLRRGR